MTTYDVYGIGNAIVDLQVLGTDEDLAALGLEKGAMKLVDLADQKRILDSIAIKDVHFSSGGAAANSMIAIAQLGGKAAYGCLVGDDERGQFYLEEMQTIGVVIKTSLLRDEITGTSVVVVTPDGERTMNTHLGATSHFSSAQLNEDMLGASQWLFVEGYLFTGEGGQAAVARAIEVAKANGVKVVLTLGDTFIPEVFRAPVLAAAEKADLIIGNASEIVALTQAKSEKEAFDLLRSRHPQSVMTLSERGVWIAWDGETIQLPAVPADVYDATGAGDMFAGAFMYGLTHGLSPKLSGELGCFLASKVVSQLGARLRADVKALAKQLIF